MKKQKVITEEEKERSRKIREGRRQWELSGKNRRPWVVPEYKRYKIRGQI